MSSVPRPLHCVDRIFIPGKSTCQPDAKPPQSSLSTHIELNDSLASTPHSHPLELRWTSESSRGGKGLPPTLECWKFKTRDPEDSVFWGEIEGVSVNEPDSAGETPNVETGGVDEGAVPTGIATTGWGSFGRKGATGGFAGGSDFCLSFWSMRRKWV